MNNNVPIANYAALLRELGGTVTAAVELPPLSTIGIGIEGTAFTLKTALLCGDPSCFLLKLPDGSPIMRRTRAEIIEVRNLRDFEAKKDKLLAYAAAHPGGDGRYRSIGIDPTIVLYDWITARILRVHNKSREKSHNLAVRYKSRGKSHNLAVRYGSTDPDEPFEPALSFGETKVSPSLYNRAAMELQSLLFQIKGVGWGWRTVTHYAWKLADFEGGQPKGSKWRSDIPETAASRIRMLADMRCICSVIRDSKRRTTEYMAEFTVEGEQCTGTRVPIAEAGSITFKPYETAPPGYTNWDTLAEEYELARDHYRREQTAFHAVDRRPQTAPRPKPKTPVGRIVKKKKKVTRRP